MKYILFSGNSYYDINLKKVADTSKSIKYITDVYGFDLKSIVDFKSISGYRIVGVKESNGTDIETTLNLNLKYAFILILFDSTNEGYTKFNSNYKCLVSKDRKNWRNYIDDDEYLEYVYDFKNLTEIDFTKLNILDYTNHDAKYLNKIKNDSFNYLLLKIDSVTESIIISYDIKLYKRTDNVVIAAQNSLDITSTNNDTANFKIVKISSDNIIDTIKEF